MLAKALECCGVSLGSNLMQPAADNPKGFFEDKQVYAINENMLATLDYQWSLVGNTPSKLSDATADTLRERVRTYLKARLASSENIKYIGIKDPRLCRLANFWIEECKALSIPYKIIFISRNPAGVAQSLIRRNNIGESGAYALWSDYNLNAIRQSLNVPTLYIQIEDFISSIRDHIAGIADFLASPVNEVELDTFESEFFEANLFNSPSKSKIPASKLFEALEQLKSCHSLDESKKEELIAAAIYDQSRASYRNGVLEQMNWHRKAENESLRDLIEQQAMLIAALKSELNEK
ncbi:MAG: hypothetical protein ACJAYC_000199 [Halieaceae bacterium]|jgi:hypothetical protein